MRITKISVTGLFGQYDHVIPLNQEDRITIIHGPNGVGKSILLRMIHGLLLANYAAFRQVRFHEFRAVFDDGRCLVVTPGKIPIKEGEIRRALQYFPASIFNGTGCEDCVTITGGGPEQQYDSVAYEDPHTDWTEAAEDIATRLPGLVQEGPASWSERETGERLTLEQVEERYGHRLFSYYLGRGPEWLREIIDSIPPLMLRTDRLEAVTFPAPTPGMMDEEPRDVAERAGLTPLQYCTWRIDRLTRGFRTGAAEAADALDRTFPARIVARLNASGEASSSASAIRQGFNDVEVMRARLAAAGLIRRQRVLTLDENGEFVGDDEFVPDEETVSMPDPANTDEAGRKVLSLYLEDTWQKLSRSKALLERIELLLRVLNQRLAITSKRLEIGSEGDFVVQTGRGTIRPEDLSSGEKHHLILFFTLLFETLPGTLVLIDEPELSMHIAWQQKFLKDLAAVAKLTDLQFLIATHSPDIIYDRWDLTVDLGGGGADVDGH